MTTLYNVVTSIDRTDGLSYRITKFVDGEVESSYLTSRSECECPAGHRSTCRHRQMLPEMLNRGLLNTHYFLDWDQGMRTCDFQGSTVLPPSMTHPAEEDTVQDTQPTDLSMTAECPPGCCEPIQSELPLPATASAWRRF